MYPLELNREYDFAHRVAFVSILSKYVLIVCFTVATHNTNLKKALVYQACLPTGRACHSASDHVYVYISVVCV